MQENILLLKSEITGTKIPFVYKKNLVFYKPAYLKTKNLLCDKTFKSGRVMNAHFYNGFKGNNKGYFCRY